MNNSLKYSRPAVYTPPAIAPTSTAKAIQKKN